MTQGDALTSAENLTHTLAANGTTHAFFIEAELHLRGRYRTSTGTTLMLLNGEPLISFVLTTVYTSTCFSASMARWIWKLLKNSDADAKPITSDRGRLAGMLTGPTARQAIENRLGSSAIPMPPLIPPVSARDM